MYEVSPWSMISRAVRTERHMIDASTSRGRESSWTGVRSTYEVEISLRDLLDGSYSAGGRSYKYQSVKM